MAEPRRSAAKDVPDRDSSDLKGARILVVEARFYEDIADALLAGATRALQEAGATFERLSVPGSLEVAPAIAMALDAAERSGRPYEFAARRCISRSCRRNRHARCSSFRSRAACRSEMASSPSTPTPRLGRAPARTRPTKAAMPRARHFRSCG